MVCSSPVVGMQSLVYALYHKPFIGYLVMLRLWIRQPHESIDIILNTSILASVNFVKYNAMLKTYSMWMDLIILDLFLTQGDIWLCTSEVIVMSCLLFISFSEWFNELCQDPLVGCVFKCFYSNPKDASLIFLLLFMLASLHISVIIIINQIIGAAQHLHKRSMWLKSD